MTKLISTLPNKNNTYATKHFRVTVIKINPEDVQISIEKL